MIIPQIRERSVVSESVAKNKPVFDMGNADATAEFNAVCGEIANRVGVRK